LQIRDPSLRNEGSLILNLYQEGRKEIQAADTDFLLCVKTETVGGPIPFN